MNQIVEFIKGLTLQRIYNLLILMSRVLLLLAFILFITWLFINFEAQVMFVLGGMYKIFTSGLHGASFVFLTVGLILYYMGQLFFSIGGKED